MSSSGKSLSSLSLKGRLKFLFRDASLYGGAAAISRTCSLITFPLLASHFSVEDYGIIDYFFVLASLLSVVFVFGQDAAVARYFYEYSKSSSRRSLISESLLIQFIGLAFVIPVLWIFSDWFTALITEIPDRVLFFRIILIQLPFLLLINFSQNLLKWSFSRTRFLAMSLGFALVQTLLLLVSVLFFDVGVAGILKVNFTTTFIFGCLGLFFVRRWLKLPKTFSYLREMFPFAASSGILSIAGALSPSLERTFTGDLLGPESLGFYAVGAKIAMLITLFVSAFQMAWGPFSLSLYKHDNASVTYNWVFKLFALCVCSASLFLTLISYNLIHLFTADRYIGSAVVIFPLSIAISIQATSWITEIGIDISKKAHLSLYGYCFSLLLTFSFLFWATPFLGLLGVGISVFLGHIIKSVTNSYLAQKAYPLKWHYTPVVVIFLFSIIAGFSSIWLYSTMGVLLSQLFLAIAISILLLLGWNLLFTFNDKRKIKTFIFKSFKSAS